MRNMSNSIYHELAKPTNIEILDEFDGDGLVIQYTGFDKNLIFCFEKIPSFIKDVNYLVEEDIEDVYVEMLRENFTYHNTSVDRMFPNTPSIEYTACIEAIIFYDEEDLPTEHEALIRTYVKGVLVNVSKRIKERLRRLPIDTKEKKVPRDSVMNRVRKFFGIKQTYDVVETMGLDYSRIHIRTMIKNASHEVRVKLGIENQKILNKLRVGMVFNVYYGCKAVERNSDIFIFPKIYRIG